MCAHASLNPQVESTERLLGRTSLGFTHPLTSNEPFCACFVRRFLTSTMKYVICSGAQPPINCPAILILKFRSTGSKSPSTLPRVGVGGNYFLPQPQILPADGVTTM